jgi:hypothetical protein
MPLLAMVALCSLGSFREERQLGRVADGWHHQRTVQVAVESLARALSHEQASMAGGTFQKSLARILGRRVRAAQGIIGAKDAEVIRALQMGEQTTALALPSPPSVPSEPGVPVEIRIAAIGVSASERAHSRSARASALAE